MSHSDSEEVGHNIHSFSGDLKILEKGANEAQRAIRLTGQGGEEFFISELVSQWLDQTTGKAPDTIP